MNTDGSIELNIEDVVQELVVTPLGQALWEAAQGRCVARKQAEVISQLRQQLGNGKAE